MKRTILFALSVLMLGTSALANTEAALFPEMHVIEQEDGAIAPQDLELLTLPQQGEWRSHSKKGEAIIGGIIGGIIGAIAADRWDRGDRGHHRPGRYVTCFAENRRGEVFRATARRARAAQDLAMQKCYDYSRSCRPLGCR